MPIKNRPREFSRSLPTVLLAAALFLPAGHVQAASGPPAAVVGSSCSAPGTTQMDAAQMEILACLYDPNNPTQLRWWRAGTAGVNLNSIPTCGLDAAGNQQVLNFNNTAGPTKGSFYCFTP